MSTVTYIGDEPREVSILPMGVPRLIRPDEKFDVPDRFAESYACQPHFFEVEGFEWPPPADLDDDDPEQLLAEVESGDEPPADNPEPVIDETPKGK